jgi:fructose-specific phosphotransferase system component IIB
MDMAVACHQATIRAETLATQGYVHEWSPTSTAAAVIVLVADSKALSRTRISKECNVSMTTLNKVLKDLQSFKANVVGCLNL